MNRDNYLNFNSIKVRLEPTDGQTVVNGNVLFQFHKGTIRTLEQVIIYITIQDFNSIKVRLELAE